MRREAAASPPADEPIGERALNRALLARQGLLDRMTTPIDQVVAAVGALQMQYWPALGPALWTRMTDCSPDDPFRAHAAGELLTGTLLRGTIHTVTAADYPAYAAVTAASKVGTWLRVDRGPGPELLDLERDLLQHAATPRTADELAEFVQAWLARHPGVVSDAELELQGRLNWRTVRSQPWIIREPVGGQWGPKTSTLLRAAPVAQRPAPDEALRTVVRCHLRAFGPAAAEDVASWIAWNITPVRKALEQMDDLATLVDEAGRVLYDLADAPRPDPDTPAPARLLPWFDSALLAYAPKWRTRILPAEYKDVVWVKVNGQLKPTFLVDGRVAGTWSLATARGTATLTLTPLQPLAATTRKELVGEAEGLVRFAQPQAKAHEVVVAD